MNFMVCTCCHRTVKVNSVGVCLGCQMGSSGPISDVWVATPEAKKDANAEVELRKILK